MGKYTYNVVAGLITNDAGLIFCAQRGKGFFQGKWEFPGGKIEDGESPECALMREIREELGCEVTVIEYIGESAVHYESFIIKLAVYRCIFTECQPIQLLVHSDSMWVFPEQLIDIDFCEPDAEIIKEMQL